MTLSIGVQLTTKCNFNCDHCFVDRLGDHISMEILKKIILFAKSLNCSSISFTGGEPTLHPMFPEIIKTLSVNGLKFTMVTNGWNFVDFYQSIKLYLTTLKAVGFSMDGCTEDVHDQNRGEGSYRRVLRAICVCKSKSIHFGLRMCITRRNIHQLEGMAILASKLGAKNLIFLPLQPTPSTATQNLLLFPEDLRFIEKEASRLRKFLKMDISLSAGYFSDDPICVCFPLTMKRLFITSIGDVVFCCQLTDYKPGMQNSDIVGNLKEMDLYQAYQQMIDMVAKYKKNKIQRLAEGKLGKLDHYHCWYCLKHFKNVDWMKKFTKNPWAEDLLNSHTSQ